MRIILIPALLLTLACSSLFADAASKDAKIDQLLLLIKADSIQDQIYTQLGVQIDRAIQGLAQQAAIAPADQKTATAELREKMIAAMKDFMSWDKLKVGLIQTYRDSFSEQELDGILAFYKGPIGQAYLTKAPAIANKSREQAEAKVKELGGMFQVMGKDWMDQHKPPATAPAPGPVPQR